MLLNPIIYYEDPAYMIYAIYRRMQSQVVVSMVFANFRFSTHTYRYLACLWSFEMILHSYLSSEHTLKIWGLCFGICMWRNIFSCTDESCRAIELWWRTIPTEVAVITLLKLIYVFIWSAWKLSCVWPSSTEFGKVGGGGVSYYILVSRPRILSEFLFARYYKIIQNLKLKLQEKEASALQAGFPPGKQGRICLPPCLKWKGPKSIMSPPRNLHKQPPNKTSTTQQNLLLTHWGLSITGLRSFKELRILGWADPTVNFTSAVDPNCPETGPSRLPPSARCLPISQASYMMPAVISKSTIHPPGAITVRMGRILEFLALVDLEDVKLPPGIIRWNLKENHPLLSYRVRRPHHRGAPQWFKTPYSREKKILHNSSSKFQENWRTSSIIRPGVLQNDQWENSRKVRPLTRILFGKYATLVTLQLNKCKHA